MIHAQPQQNVPEPAEGKPVSSAEEWLGRNANGRQKLWERLNPRHRKMLRMLGRALVLRQQKGNVPETAWQKLIAALDELERLARRIEQLLAALASRTPPTGE